MAELEQLGQTQEFAYLAEEARRRLEQINGPQEQRHD